MAVAVSRKIKFRKSYSLSKNEGEVNDGEDIVERAGYMPAEIQIRRMIEAGERLNDYRQGQYDFGPEDEDDESYSDPTRDPGFDMADASQLAMQAEANLKASAEVQKKAQEEIQKAQETPETEEAGKDVVLPV